MKPLLLLAGRVLLAFAVTSLILSWIVCQWFCFGLLADSARVQLYVHVDAGGLFFDLRRPERVAPARGLPPSSQTMELVEELPDGRGRPKVYDIAASHIQATIEDWHAGEYVEGKWRSKYTPAGIMERARLRTGFKGLPDHWARNIMVAEFGSAVRNPHGIVKKGNQDG
mgnify:CR=1 FL=1